MPIDRDGDGPPLRRTENKVSLTPGEGRGDDLRATAFTDDVFNDDYYGKRIRPKDNGRSLSVVIGVVLGVIVAGGAGWYLFRGSGVTFTPGEVGFIKAEPAPYKVKPDNPGGMQVDNQDKLVYDRVAKGNAPNRVENLLPPVEEPKAPPMKQPEPAPAPAAAPAPTAPTPVQTATAPAPEPAKVEPKPEPVKEAAKPAEPPKEVAPKEVARETPKAPAPDPLAAAVAAATGGRPSATGPVEAPKPEAPKAEPAKPVQTATAMPAPTTPAASAASAGSGFQIQLASVLSEQAAMAEWKRISGRNKDLLAGLAPAVTKADLGDKGVFYRLRAGPLADKAAADAMCSSLATANVGCIVIKP